MKLFKIQFDSQDDYIEAENMPEAIGKWHAHCRSQDPEWDNPQTPDPDGCALVHEQAVIR